ncbi:biopolymer transporter Tol [Puniceicoccales bacterium CK1056]|uniref:Biopolymer transporter Tol n=1 Tax=Oceanipulchritudo coccoides TaxID=2706888 RepID=A0A6B2LZL4_9BACT|nr:PD40 domain-containing protein [Oceanipulchritudo coccoides]NDV62108.1 biopolymer transporter Tol [Oceanipulchritudo coccoides]
MNLKISRLTVSLIFLCLGSLLPAQNPINLGDVVGSATVTTRTVQITGSPASLVNDAARLFDLHGGYKRVVDRADFTLQFQSAGPTTVALEILSGGKSLWKSSFQGSSQNDALYAAADAAVSRTLGIPGFFRSQVAFISDRTGSAEVYMSDILFKGIRQLTRDRSQCLSPNLSPDGQTVLYTSYHGTGFPDIYRIDLRTGKRTVFAGFKGTNTGATFGPDGRQVAMILSGSGNSEVYITNNQGRQLRRLTRSASLEADPSWSPDGRRIIFTSDQMGGPQIYTMDVQGRSVSRVRTDISRNCSEPTWNPVDSGKIAFTAAVAGEFEVAVYSFKENKSTIISKGAGDAVHPVWLRDGRHLVYTERTPRYSRLMILDSLTGNRMRLSPSELNNAREASPAYLGN